MPERLANGLRFHAVELGQGAPVIAIHGLLVGNIASWYFTLAPVLRQRHRLLLYDLRGHGRSERPTQGYDLNTMTQDLHALADSFCSEPVTLIGHSYGALIALRFALKYPERVQRLVLIEAPLPPADFGEITGFLKQDPTDMMQALPPSLRDAFEGGGRRSRNWLRTLAFLSQETNLLATLGEEPDIDDDILSTIRCPTLCVFGSQSSCRPVGERLASLIPGARLVVLPGGHFLPTEQPAELGAAVEGFLNG